MKWVLLLLSFAGLGARGQGAVDSTTVENGVDIIACDFDLQLAPEPLNLDDFKAALSYPIGMECIEGVVVVRVLVSKRGEVLDYYIVRSPHPRLSKEVLKHVPMLRFTPAIRGKKGPTNFWVHVPVRFRLR